MKVLKIHNAKAEFPEDPTKTVGIRKRWIAQVNLRYGILAKRINDLLLRGNEGGVPVPRVDPVTLKVNAFEYTNDPVAVLRFMAWLQVQTQLVIIGNDATAINNWQNQYIDQSYERGIKRTQADLRRLDIDASMLKSVTAADIVGTATPSLGIIPGGQKLNGPIHMEAIRTLYLRAYSDLNGITDEMNKQIRRVLVEGIEQGLGIRDIAKDINGRVDAIGVTRSQLLARTETVRAYNVATVAEFKDVADRAGIEPAYKWVTAGDARVRPEHAQRNGKVYPADEALSMLGDPNCRCSLTPYVDPELLEDVA